MKEKKLLSSFFKKGKCSKISVLCLFGEDYLLNKKISLPVDNPSLYLSKLQFPYFGLLSLYRTVQN